MHQDDRRRRHQHHVPRPAFHGAAGRPDRDQPGQRQPERGDVEVDRHRQRTGQPAGVRHLEPARGEFRVGPLEEPGEHRVFHVPRLVFRGLRVLVPRRVVRDGVRVVEPFRAVERDDVGVAHRDERAARTPVEQVVPVLVLVLLDARALAEPAQHQREHGDEQARPLWRPEPVPADRGMLAERPADRPGDRRDQGLLPARRDAVGRGQAERSRRLAGRGVWHVADVSGDRPPAL